MNDVAELWSHPWHALQRNLAETFKNEPSIQSWQRGCLNPRHKGTGSTTWLTRARTCRLQTAAANL
jgi:hypothetical protein